MVAFVLEFLRGLMPLHPLSSPQLPPFVLLILSSHFTATVVHFPPFPLPSTTSLTLYGRGKFSRSGNLSGKVWLFNFLAAVCQRIPPPYSHRGNVHLGWTFFSSLVNPLIAWRWWLSSFASREQITGELIDQLERGTLSFTSNFSISRNFCYR